MFVPRDRPGGGSFEHRYKNMQKTEELTFTNTRQELAEYSRLKCKRP